MNYEVRITGVLGKDAKYQQGVSKAGKDYEALYFSLAPSFKRDEEWTSEWFDVVVFGHLAKKFMALQKRDRVFVEGEYYETTYEGKVQKKVRATKILQLYKPGQSEDLPNAQPQASVAPSIDDIPF